MAKVLILLPCKGERPSKEHTHARKGRGPSAPRSTRTRRIRTNAKVTTHHVAGSRLQSQERSDLPVAPRAHGSCTRSADELQRLGSAGPRDLDLDEASGGEHRAHRLVVVGVHP